MPKIFNTHFSAITTINSVTSSTINNLENISYNDNGDNMVVVGRFKGFDNYVSMITRLLPNGNQDPSFNIGTGFFTKNGDDDNRNNVGGTLIITKIKIDSDGNYYVVGSFYQYRNITNNWIIKLFPNGDQDTSFNSGTGFKNTNQSSVNRISDLKILSDGKLLVSGLFNRYNESVVSGLVKLNTDGSLDNTFNNNNGLGSITSIALDSLENIFCTINTTGQSLKKLLPNGNLDSTFVTGSFAGSGAPAKVVLDSNDNLFVIGGFTTYSGVSTNRIVKLLPNGERDNTFVIGTGFNNTLNDIIVDSFGKLYVRGSFTTYNGATNNSIIKLNTNGSKDTSFSNSSFSNLNASGLGCLKLDQNGNLLVGGQITTYSTEFVGAPIRVTTGGTLDTSFSFYGNVSGGQVIYDIETDSVGNIIICGQFNSYKQPLGLYSLKTYNGKTNNNFNPNYGVNTTSPGSSLSTRAIIKNQSNNLYIGGYFENYNLPNSNYRAIALLGLDLSGNPNNTINVTTGANNTISRIYEDNNGGIFLGGFGFTTYKGVNVPSFVKINPDASIDNSFNRSGIQSGTGYELIIDFDSSNNIYMGGGFTTFSGQTNNRIIKVYQNGYKDTSFDNSIGFDNAVTALYVDSNDKILVGGIFTTYKGVTANRIIRLNPDGSKDLTFDNSIGFNGQVTDIIMFNNKIYITGDFTTYKDKSNVRLIRLNYDGSIDTTFKQKLGITSVATVISQRLNVDNNGNIYLYGSTINYQNYGFSQIIKIKPDGSRDPLFYVYSDNFRRSVLTSNGSIFGICFI